MIYVDEEKIKKNEIKYKSDLKSLNNMKKKYIGK
jgi:hypothetical protein